MKIVLNTLYGYFILAAFAVTMLVTYQYDHFTAGYWANMYGQYQAIFMSNGLYLFGTAFRDATQAWSQVNIIKE